MASGQLDGLDTEALWTSTLRRIDELAKYEKTHEPPALPDA